MGMDRKAQDKAERIAQLSGILKDVPPKIFLLDKNIVFAYEAYNPRIGPFREIIRIAFPGAEVGDTQVHTANLLRLQKFYTISLSPDTYARLKAVAEDLPKPFRAANLEQVAIQMQSETRQSTAQL